MGTVFRALMVKVLSPSKSIFLSVIIFGSLAIASGCGASKGTTEATQKATPEDEVNRGNALVKSGEPDDAIASYSNAIQLKPDLADAYFNRGYAYGESGNSDRAIADYSEAIRLKPNDAEAYYNRGYAYGEKKGDHDRAIADYSEAIRLKPDFAKAYHNRGVAYGKKGEKSNADADFAKAKELGYKGP